MGRRTGGFGQAPGRGAVELPKRPPLRAASGVRPDGSVAGAPEGPFSPGIVREVEEFLVRRLVAQAAVE